MNSSNLHKSINPNMPINPFFNKCPTTNFNNYNNNFNSNYN